MQDYILLAVIVVNVLTFLAFGLDKWKARRGRYRVAEKHLLLLAAATGAIGAWCGISAFRHKTRKTSFRWKLVFATAVNALWIWAWWGWGRGV